MTRCYCDRCGKETNKLIPIMIPIERINNRDFKVKPTELCEDCVREYEDIMIKLADIRHVMFSGFMKGGAE